MQDQATLDRRLTLALEHVHELQGRLRSEVKRNGILCLTIAALAIALALTATVALVHL